MALDRQKILSELGSVVSQLQSANCGCLGGLFEKTTPSTQYSSHAHAPPSCGGHHHSCYARPSYSASCSNNNQRHGHCVSNCNSQKLFTDGTNYINNNIVQPIVKEVYEELKSISPENTVANSPLALQMGLPCSPAMPQGAQQGSGQNFVNMADKKPNFVNKPENRTDNNQSLNEMNNKGAAYNQHSYEQHAQGLAKFKEMFPGIMGQGDLGFDPMKVAIQMRAMDKTNTKEVRKPINSNYEVPKLHPCQLSNAPHTPNLNNSPDNTNMLTNPMPIIDSSLNLMPMNAPNNPYNNQVPAYSENCHDTPMYHNDQQTHYAVSGQPLIQKQDTNENPNHMQHQPPIDLSAISNFFKKSQINPKAQPVTQTNPETANYNHNLCPPTDPYKSQPDTPPKLPSCENNILGQPIEMLPANVYHYPEPNLPQTLSPQPLKSRYSNVKSTLSKTSLTGTKPVGRTISRNHLQRMYNEYRGSQSFIPPKPTPQGVTHSEGQLNATNPNYNVDKFLERTAGDTELNKEIIQKIEAVGQLGDVPASNDLNNNITEKLSSDTGGRAVRNGLQDIVFTSYPTSTAWSFHGSGR